MMELYDCITVCTLIICFTLMVCTAIRSCEHTVEDYHDDRDNGREDKEKLI